MQQCRNVKPFFERVCIPNWPEEVFVINKVKNTVS